MYAFIVSVFYFRARARTLAHLNAVLAARGF